jgi:hypothetical protein
MANHTDIMKILGRFLGENEREWDIQNFIGLETDETKIRAALAIKQSSIENFLFIRDIYESRSPTLSDLCSSIVNQDYETLRDLVNFSKEIGSEDFDALMASNLALPALECVSTKGDLSIQKEIVKRCLNFKRSCLATFKVMEQTSKDPRLKKIFFKSAEIEEGHTKTLAIFFKNLNDLVRYPGSFQKAFGNGKRVIQ